MKKVLIWRKIFYGEMKTHIFIITSLCTFIIISWSFFLIALFILSEDSSKLEDSLGNIESKMDYLNDAVDSLSDEKIFEREMMENLAYYLPEGFSGKVRYIGLTSLDLEAGEARVYFTYRHNKYKADFFYYYNKHLTIDRKSPVELIQ